MMYTPPTFKGLCPVVYVTFR